MSDLLARLQAALADRYDIDREVGRGGTATVYLAQDLKHQRRVALKVLRPELASVVGAERFVREIRTVARLQHPHILPLFDSGETDGFLYYIMPFVEGESLRERLTRERRLPISEAVRILREIADALAHAHQHGFVHRDIKPENVMISGRHAVVADFGVAKAVSTAGPEKLTTVGLALGTPTYMAPEQAVADPHIDHRADIYSVGALAYELLTGAPPFERSTVQELLAAHVLETPAPPASHRPEITPALSSLVMRCLEKDRHARFQTAEELLPQLDALGTPGGTTPVDTAPDPTVRARRGRRARYFAAAVVASGLVGWAVLELRARSAVVIGFANIRQVTHEPEAQIHVAISPDGREIAYQSGYTGATHIVLRDIAGGRPLSLTGEWGGFQALPQWTPDGRSISFINATTTADHHDGVWTLPRMGGSAVASDSSATPWAARDVALVIHGDSGFARRADGHETLLFTAAADVHGEAWSDDGTELAYVRGNTDYDWLWGNLAPSAIWVVPVGGRPVQVTANTALNVSPAWLPDGTLLFVSDRDGARDIYGVRLDRTGTPRGPPTRLTTGLDVYSLSVSTDGVTAAYDRFMLRRNIYSLPIPRSGSASIASAQPVTTGNQTIESLAISADGKWLAFDSNLDGHQNIYVQATAGGEARRVTSGPGGNYCPDFSPDGHQIAFHSTRGTTRDIYIINTDGTGERQLTSDSEESYRPAFSPDGLRIAYGNLSGTLGLLRRATRDGPWRGPERLSGTGFAPRWSPDGSRVVVHDYLGQDAIGTITLDGAERALIDTTRTSLRHLGWPQWAADGRLVYFRAFGPDGMQSVYQIGAGGGPVRLLVRFDDPSRRVFNGSVLVGGGRFYFAVAEVESDIYVMDLVRR